MTLCTRCFKPLEFPEMDPKYAPADLPTAHSWDCEPPRCSTCGKSMNPESAPPSVLKKRSGRCRACDADYQRRMTAAYKAKLANDSRALKLEVYGFYCGGPDVIACQCDGCKTSELCFLTVDHMLDKEKSPDCSSEGKKLHGSELLLWLKKNNYPEGFQVLCFNCNCSKRDLDACPMEGMDH